MINMKKFTRKVLIASGDSWTKEKRSFPHWPEILANKLDMKYINLGCAGKGNEFIYNNMIDTLCTTRQIGLSICLWSSASRWDFDKWTFNINPKHPNPLKGFDTVAANEHKKVIDAIHEHGGLVSGKHNLLKSVRWFHAFQNHCELHSIPYLQMQAFTLTFPTDALIKALINSAQVDSIDDNKFIGWPMYEEIGGKTAWTMLDEVDPEQIKLRVSKDDLHPNKEGQELIAEVLYDKYREIYE